MDSGASRPPHGHGCLRERSLSTHLHSDSQTAAAPTEGMLRGQSGDWLEDFPETPGDRERVCVLGGGGGGGRDREGRA